MIDSLSRCNQCNLPVTDSIQVEIENHGRVKLGKNIQDSWICNDCMVKRTSTIKDDGNNSAHHEHVGVANKAEVSPNTPKAEEADLKSDSS